MCYAAAIEKLIMKTGVSLLFSGETASSSLPRMVVGKLFACCRVQPGRNQMSARGVKLLITALLAAVVVFGVSGQEDWPQLRLTKVGEGGFLPVQVVQPHDNTHRFFVVEQPGRIQIYQPGALTPEVFLDITDRVNFFFGGEDGLLSMAFPPGFVAKRYFYVFYTHSDGREIVSRFSLSSTNDNRANSASEQVLLEMPREFITTVNSGQLLFGPDEYLYIGVGDWGFDQIIPNAAQDPKSLFGKILRLDTETSTTAYQVPASNPFLSNTNYRAEIWALGFRNPYRFSFDRLNGDLYIGDVGQLTWEELNYQPGSSPGGENYGWPVREGRHPYQLSCTECPTFTDPVFESQHLEGPSAIIGGFVYRGPDSPRLNGLYLFADFYSGVIKGLRRTGTNWKAEAIGWTPHFISSFGEDQDGRLYITDYLSGEFYRVEDNGQAAMPSFSPTAGTVFSEGIVISCNSTGVTIRYTVDGSEPNASASSVPGGGTITVTNGSVVKARAFRVDLQPSDVATANFTLKTGIPLFTPAHGPVTKGSPISLSTLTPGATVRFTLDGSDPTSSSTIYTTPVTYAPGQVLRAQAFKEGFLDSAIASFQLSAFELQDTRVVTWNGDTAFSWHSATNSLYQVQFTDDFHEWFNATPPIWGAGTPMSYTNVQVFPYRTMRHFRVRSWQE